MGKVFEDTGRQTRDGRSYWTLARLDGNRERLLALDGGRALPVFSSDEEAASFLRARSFEDEWSAQKADPEELVSVLLGAAGDVERVVLDPFPVEGVRPLNRLVSVERLRFVEELLGSLDEEEPYARPQLQGSRTAS